MTRELTTSKLLGDRPNHPYCGEAEYFELLIFSAGIPAVTRLRIIVSRKRVFSEIALDSCFSFVETTKVILAISV